MNEERLLENKHWISKLANEAMESIPDGFSEDHSTTLSEIQSRIQDIQKEIYGKEEPTIKSIVQELHDLSEATFEREPVYGLFTVEDLQELLLMRVEILSELLGIDLIDRNNNMEDL